MVFSTTSTDPANSSATRRAICCGCCVLVVALFSFGRDLDSEPHFVDESAYISQSYFFDWLLEGKIHDRVWLDYPAYDLPPLSKYLVGASLAVRGIPRPPPSAAWDWYRNTGTRFGSIETLRAARAPSVVLGALGCVALFAIGTTAGGPRTGLIAAFLLMMNPLYRMHARRAMSDVHAESFILITVAIGLWAWVGFVSENAGRRRPTWAWAALAIGAGVSGGLATLAKLSGALGVMTLVAWAVFGAAVGRGSFRKKAGLVSATVVAGFVSFGVFAILNPCLYARPSGPFEPRYAEFAQKSFFGRVKAVADHRVAVSTEGRKSFPHNALNTLDQKLSAVAVQGYGRFGPLGPSRSDSTKRFDFGQDWGAFPWLVLVAVGAGVGFVSSRRRRRSGSPPVEWAALIMSTIAFLSISLFIPLAWDRYYMSLQPGAALLGAWAAVGLWEGIRGANSGRDPDGYRRAALIVFVTLLASYSFFWQRRDWNTASRLMLTYALVDRGAISLDGLDDQTGDKAFKDGHYYSDKLPGYSFLATAPYAWAKRLLGLPDHPLKSPGFPYWEADYWTALGTSGALTALCGALLVFVSRDFGASATRAGMIGLAYGLATPAYVYATLAHGHQSSALMLFASFLLLRPREGAGPNASAFLAGALAAYASVVELQVGPVSAILGFCLIGLVAAKRRKPEAVLWFGLGALGPTLFLFAYNTAAFGSPWKMGYFFHATERFSALHSKENPLGLGTPDWSLADDLLWGTRRGILIYAPILILAPIGLFKMVGKRAWDAAIAASLAIAAVFLVNLSYPEWTGGWSTGPRLLLPMIPFAMLLVAASWATAGRLLGATAGLLTLAGAAVMLLCAGVGGRIPEPIENPLWDQVVPTWLGGRIPDWLYGDRFGRNLVQAFAPGVTRLPAGIQWIQFVPLLLFQAGAIALLRRRPRKHPRRKTAARAGPSAVGAGRYRDGETAPTAETGGSRTIMDQQETGE